MIQPTIGRVVLFYRGSFGMQPEPALVSYVHNDRMINVGGFNRDGVPFSRTSLTLLQPGDPIPPIGPYATWMPYQIDQATKHEKQPTLKEALAEHKADKQ